MVFAMESPRPVPCCSGAENAVEGVDNALAFAWGNAGAVVFHPDVEVFGGFVKAQIDAAAFRGVADGVCR